MLVSCIVLLVLAGIFDAAGNRCRIARGFAAAEVDRFLGTPAFFLQLLATVFFFGRGVPFFFAFVVPVTGIST